MEHKNLVSKLFSHLNYIRYKKYPTISLSQSIHTFILIKDKSKTYRSFNILKCKGKIAVIHYENGNKESHRLYLEAKEFLIKNKILFEEMTIFSPLSLVGKIYQQAYSKSGVIEKAILPKKDTLDIFMQIYGFANTHNDLSK